MEQGNEAQKPKNNSAPIIWAVGGGKGGVGKSMISVLLSFWLAKLGKRTVLIDLDLGGANLHTMLGIKNPDYTLNDFITKKVDSLEKIWLNTDLDNLHFISGACEILSLANPPYAQKMKLIRHISNLDADYIVLDLGAGTSFNTLDFFLNAHQKILVITPQPISIQNAYGFIRNAVYRRLNQLCSRQPALQILVKSAVDPKNKFKVKSIKELFHAIETSSSKEIMEDLQKEIAEIKPAVITNMTSNQKDKNAGRIIQFVSEKYLMLHPTDLGNVVYDQQISNMISGMVPLTNLDNSSEAYATTYDLITKLM